ncbi:MAG: GH32 C-terminal domain-containing protein [Lachnospiraceae bacterium]|nr:GH32 C-terminal domain-containing protein [Lachnospiraceae bacterium]
MEYTLENARRYEREAVKDIAKDARPKYHLTPGVGWMNDPNGLSYYKGEYHLFYQYYPYDTNWGKMHWGHAVSKDLITWKHLPVALAPDETYDSEGCFSGGALALPDGRHMLMYTGVSPAKDENGNDITVQQQCLAFGDGTDYKKYEKNPVISSEDLPEGLSKVDFRDPCLFRKEDGSFGCVTGCCNSEKDGRIVEFESPDGLNWRFSRVLIECNKKLGRMWECPNIFNIQGKNALIFSPQEIKGMQPEFADGNQTVIITDRDGNGNFDLHTAQCLDYGTDFYAPQVLKMPDGRFVIIGWLQNWDTLRHNEKSRVFFGTMSIPRVISFDGERLIQKPLESIDNYRKVEKKFDFVVKNGSYSDHSLKGRRFDMMLDIAPDGEECYKEFSVKLAVCGSCATVLTYRPEEGLFKIDKSSDGTEKEKQRERSCLLYKAPSDGRLSLRILMDKNTMEVFINGGTNVVSAIVETDEASEGISFEADGEVKVKAEFYEM